MPDYTETSTYLSFPLAKTRSNAARSIWKKRMKLLQGKLTNSKSA